MKDMIFILSKAAAVPEGPGFPVPLPGGAEGAGGGRVPLHRAGA